MKRVFKLTKSFPACRLAVGICGLSMVAVVSAESYQAPPIPESSGTYSWSERQRLRFTNTSLVRDAHKAIAAKEYAKAESLLKQILSNDPANNHAKAYLVEIYDNQGKYDQGIELSSELLSAFPDYLDMQAYRGFMLLKSGKLQEAVKDFEDLLSKADKSYALRNEIEKNLAEQYFLLEDMDKAATYARSTLERTNSPAMRKLLAEIAIRQKELNTATTQIEQAILSSSSAEEEDDLSLKLAYVHFDNERYADVLDLLQPLYAKFNTPEKRDAANRLIGQAAFRTEDYETAETAFKRVLDEKFSEPLASSYLLTLSRSGKSGLGEQQAKAFLGRDDISASFQSTTLLQLIFLLKDQKKYAEAYPFTKTLIELDPSAENLKEAGLIAEKTGRYEQAADLYTRLVEEEFDPENVLSLHFVRKTLADKTEDEQEKISILSKSLPLLQASLKLPEVPSQTENVLSYELAQIYRITGDMDAYFTIMEALIGEDPDSEFAYEYAVQLYGHGRYDEAVQMFIHSIGTAGRESRDYETCKVLADIFLIQGNVDESVKWLETARQYGDAEADRMWHLFYARADYQRQNYKEVIRRLLPIAEEDGIFHMYIGFSFYQSDMPGLALLHLNRVTDLEKLSPEEKQAFYANRAYLNYDQDQDEAALKDVDRSLSIRDTNELKLVRLKTLIRMGQLDEAAAYGKTLIEEDPNLALKNELYEMLNQHPDEAYRAEMATQIEAAADTEYTAQLHETTGLALFQMGRLGDAIDYYSKAITYNPENVSAYYMRGLAYFQAGDFPEAEADFLNVYNKAESFPPTFWGDLGVLQGDLEAYSLGTAALERSTSFYPYDVDAYEEMGYQYQKFGDNRQAQLAFRRSSHFYREVLPFMDGKEQVEYSEAQRLMKKENTKLDKIWGLQSYLQRTDYNYTTLNNSELSQAESIDGVLISQAGVGITYRPPNIGYRDGRELDFSLRVLANLEPNSFRPDEDTYQGGAGVLFKPLRRYNYRVSMERLFKIGDNSENNWLWRNVYSWEHGETPPPYESVWLYNRIYGEISYYLEDVKRWVYYINPRAGYSYTLNTDRAIMTFPEIIGVARYQSNDPVGIGTYFYYGLGGNLRLFGRETEYTINRWYVDLYAHYVLGRFSSLPDENKEDTYFDGVVFGVNFTK